MLRQLEDSENAQNPDEDERTGLFRRLAVALRLLDDEYDEEWDDGEYVEDVHDVLAEGELGRTGDETQDELAGEPRNTDGLDDEERIAVVRTQVDRRPGGVRLVGDVDADRSVEARHRFHAEIDDGREDAGDGQKGKYLRRAGTVRLFAQQPDFALPFQLVKKHNEG